VLVKIRKQMTKDYVVHPLLSGPSFFHTVAANATANRSATCGPTR
jgi:linoleoyl-CoA desaturase